MPAGVGRIEGFYTWIAFLPFSICEVWNNFSTKAYLARAIFECYIKQVKLAYDFALVRLQK